MKYALQKLNFGVLIAVLFILLFNSYQIGKLKSSNVITSSATKPDTKDIGVVYDFEVLPKGVPRVYGEELGISYDDVSASDQQKADATIRKLGILDQQITLSGRNMERYIAVASQISCEYCCGVESIIFSNGAPACSCQHSFAMRGLAKYLIKNHGNEYTDEQILEELGKWKTLFFPAQMMKKAQILQAKGIELNYINLASNKYRGLESGN